MKHSCVCLFWIVLIVFSFVSQAESYSISTDDGHEIGTWLVYEGYQPGDIIQANVIVKLSNEGPFSLFVYPGTITWASNYPPAAVPYGYPPEDLALWMQMPEFRGEVAPYENISLPLTISIPINATPGGYMGAICYSQDPGGGGCKRVYLTVDGGAANRTTSNGFLANITNEERFEFIDIDYDGLVDRLSSAHLYRNVGDTQRPVFELETLNYSGLPNYAKPSFGDIDGDGKVEMLVPQWPKQLALYENVADVNEQPVWLLSDENHLVLETDYILDTTLYDIDDDGDQDLFITSRWGKIYLYRNDATNGIAQWALISSDYYADFTDMPDYFTIPILDSRAPLKIAFMDRDLDGIDEMIVGDTKGLKLFKLVQNSPEKIWKYLPNELDYLGVDLSCSPSTADLNGDGKKELHVACLLGQYTIEFEPLVKDTDGDGVVDDDDNCTDISNAEQTDTDLDGVGDVCDPDDDNDLLLDVNDNCPLNQNPDQTDFDADGLGNACDADPDGDGIIDDEFGFDNCPMTPNPYQDDSDGDGFGDACDADDDNDGICDTGMKTEICMAGPDNCATVVNFDQADLDSDQIGDVCDADLDGDGIDNAIDNCQLKSNPGQDDTDADGLGDNCDSDDDNDSFPDANDNCPMVWNMAQDDSDNDGTGDLCDADLDGDGIMNEADNCLNIPNSAQTDLNGDGIGDACDNDVDGDYVLNNEDLCPATPFGDVVNPGNGCSLAQLCPCDGARGTSQLWKNHGKYVSCVAHATAEYVQLNLITETDKGGLVSEAANSLCGK
jgi:hypothetical protein